MEMLIMNSIKNYRMEAKFMAVTQFYDENTL